jgi:regulator of sigma E protease
VTFLLGLICLSLLIIVHELAHFGAARLLRIPVNEFGVGFGPRLLGTTIRGTRYVWRLIPVGGYVSIEGEQRAAPDDRAAFINRPLWQRSLVIIAGPLANILVGVAIFALLLATLTTTFTITQITSGSPAATAGLLVNDRVISIDGQPPTTETSLKEAIGAAATRGAALTLVVAQPSQAPRNVVVTPGAAGTIGIAYDGYVRQSLPAALLASLDFSRQVVVSIGQGLVALASGASGAQLAGPIGISTTLGEQITSNNPLLFWQILALISVNLGVMNLLPLLPLDGGRLFLGILKSFRRRDLSPQTEMGFMLTGLALFAFVLLVASIGDIARLLSS